MKLIRMLKTMAGPNGVRSPGMKPFTVSNEEAEQLVAAEAAEVIATIADALVEVETTALSGAPEMAVVDQMPKTKRPAKKA